MDIDLNEDNYNYEDLLNLFSIDKNFTKKDLKIAYKKVLQLHPDKSKLDPKYFLFFRKMFFKIEQIYNFTHHETNEDNLKKQIDIQTHFKDYLERKKINPINNYEQFTKEFNKMFENVYIREDKDGYDNWLKSDDDFYDKNDLEKSRKMALNNSIIIKENDLEEVGLSSHNNNNRLNYFDVKETHSNPIIALDVNDIYSKKQKFKSVQEYQLFLAKEDKKNKPLSLSQSEELLNHKEKLLEEQSKHLAYQNMVKSTNEQKKYNNYITNYLKLEI